MMSIKNKISLVKEDFPFLKSLLNCGCFELKLGSDYAEVIVNANIPYKPGVYFVYSLDNNGESTNLLYYGKAGVASNKGNPKLSFHQLPYRLLATTSLPTIHDYFSGKSINQKIRKKI